MSSRPTRHRLVARGDLPGSNGGIYNPGALLDGDRILLLCRREIDYRFRNAFVFPELLAIDRRTLELRDHRTLRKVGFSRDTRIEDFRCLAFGGMDLVAHSAVRTDRIRPVISRMYADALQRYDDFELPVGDRPVEKNWVLFVHEGRLHCLYMLDPLTIFVRADEGQWRLVKEEDNGWASEFRGFLSNSANLIPFGDGYLGFWHSIVDDRYLQGAFLLDRTLAIRFSTGPLLDGREITDGFKPGVIYVSSLIEDGDRVLAFYGEGDAHTGVAIFDSRELAEELRRSPFAPRVTLHLLFDGTSLSDAFRGMQQLRVFSAHRNHPSIRLYVADPALRETMERLALPNVVLRDRSRADSVHGTLVGGTGAFRWEDPQDREP